MLSKIKLIVALFFATAVFLFAPSATDSFAFSSDKNGKKIYDQYCVLCHGENGKPLTPNIPDLSRRRGGLVKPDLVLLDVIYNGVGVMPGYRGIVSDSDVRDVLEYIKFNF